MGSERSSSTALLIKLLPPQLKQSLVSQWLLVIVTDAQSWFSSLFSCDQQLHRSLCQSAGWLVSLQKFFILWRPQFHPRRLKFGMEVSVCVKVCVCFHSIGYKGTWQWEWPIVKRHKTSKWIHRLAQDLVERLVMSQRTAD